MFSRIKLFYKDFDFQFVFFNLLASFLAILQST